MRQPSFVEGVVVALTASMTGSVVYPALSWVWIGMTPLHLLIAGLSLAYVLYLLGRSDRRVGRIVTLAGWTLAAGLAWWAEPSLAVYLAVHLAIVWLTRSVYFHSGMLGALADLGLAGLGVAAGAWAASQSGSLFLTLWCFFLVQALFVTIPPHLPVSRAEKRGSGPDLDDRFGRAHRAAETALRRLSSTR